MVFLILFTIMLLAITAIDYYMKFDNKIYDKNRTSTFKSFYSRIKLFNQSEENEFLFIKDLIRTQTAKINLYYTLLFANFYLNNNNPFKSLLIQYVNTASLSDETKNYIIHKRIKETKVYSFRYFIILSIAIALLTLFYIKSFITLIQNDNYIIVVTTSLFYLIYLGTTVKNLIFAYVVEITPNRKVSLKTRNAKMQKSLNNYIVFLEHYYSYTVNKNVMLDNAKQLHYMLSINSNVKLLDADYYNYKRNMSLLLDYFATNEINEQQVNLLLDRINTQLQSLLIHNNNVNKDNITVNIN